MGDFDPNIRIAYGDPALDALKTRFERASKLVSQPVLDEILRFYKAINDHNKAALSDIPAKEIVAEDYVSGTFSLLVQSVEGHAGKDAVDPNLMPWQYRR